MYIIGYGRMIMNPSKYQNTKVRTEVEARNKGRVKTITEMGELLVIDSDPVTIQEKYPLHIGILHHI